MKWIKRILMLAALVLVLLIVGSAISVLMINAQPEWYRTHRLTTQQAEAAAQLMEDKLVILHNQAADATTRPVSSGHFSMTLSQDELEAFSAKWFNQAKNKNDMFLVDPRLFIHESRLILAGRLKEKNILTSFHFEPRVDAQGRFDPNLVQVMGGKLPLPESIFKKPRQQAITSLEGKIPIWRNSAQLRRDGTCNAAMSSAGWGKLMIATLTHAPTDPYLFIPVDRNSSMPIKLLSVKVENNALAIEAEMLSAAQREEVLTRMKSAGAVSVEGKADEAATRGQ